MSALCRALEVWRSVADPGGRFTVAAATQPVEEHAFFRPADFAMPFPLDLSEKRQVKWDRLMADLPSIHGLRIGSDLGFGHHGAHADHEQRFAARVCLHYISPAPHPRLPDYATRLGHVSLSLPAGRARRPRSSR